MVKNPKQQIVKQSLQIKEQDSTGQKIISFLYKLFCGQQGIQKQINRSIVSNIYYQILEIIHTILLFTIFKSTNNTMYSIVQSSMGGYFLLVCLIPRISKKNIIFQINFILYLLGTIGSGFAMIILFNNFSTFEFYCKQIQTYYFKNLKNNYPSKILCQKISEMYMIQVICEIIVLLSRLFYLVMCFRAYMIAQEKHDEQEKKKRRRDRYNQLIMKRNTYNQKRKV